MDNVVDTLKIEVEGDSKNAVDGIDKLINTLEKIKRVTSDSDKGLNRHSKTLDKITEITSKINSGNTKKLKELTKGINTLSGIKDIKISDKLADKIVNLGAAVDSIKNVDFSKLHEMSDGLKALGAVKNIKLPGSRGESSRTANSKAPSQTPKGGEVDITSPVDNVKKRLNEIKSVFSNFKSIIPKPVIEETRSALNNLTKDLDKNRSLWTDIAKVGKRDVAGIAASGIIQFNILKSKLSDFANVMKEKMKPAADTVTKKMKPAASAAQYMWNTITQPVSGAVSLLGKVGNKFGEICKKSKSVISAFSSVGKFALKGGGAVAKGFVGLAAKPFTSFIDKVKSGTQRLGQFFSSLKRIAMYRAIRALLGAVTQGFKEGIANCYQYSNAIGGTLAKSLDSISSSFLYFKNSIGAAAAPLINLLAPAIDYIIDKCVALINVLNQLFAKLSGAATWTKAIKYPKKYAQAANSATKANKELKKSILGIDEINALQDNTSSESGGGSSSGDNYGAMFEEKSIGDIINPFSDFFKVLADSWANEGQNTINAVKYALNETKSLIGSIGESLKTVWTNGTGQKTVETILRTFQNIFICIGNISDSLKTAWNDNGTGTAILQDWWNILNNILGVFEGLFKSTADWAKSIDLSPILTSFEMVSAALQPFVALISESLLWAYENVLLPLGSWTIGTAAPIALEILAAAIETITNIIKIFQPLGNWLWNSLLTPLGEWTGNIFIKAFEKINDLLSRFNDCLEGNTTFGEFLDRMSFGESILLSVGTAIGIVSAAVGIWNVVSAIAAGVTAAFGAAISFLTAPITLVVVAIAALIAVGVLLYKNWDDIKTKASSAWNGIKNNISAALDNVKTKTSKAFSNIKSTVGTTCDGIKSKASTSFDNIKTKISGSWNELKTNSRNSWSNIKSSLYNAFEGIKLNADNVFGSMKTSVVSIWNSLWTSIKGVINSILGGAESMANGVIKGLNSMSTAMNKLSFDIPEWVPGLGGKKFGFNIKTMNTVSIPRLADGGVVSAGQMFIAREAGAELVGNVGRRTAVMNNDQIVESVSQGVADANAEQNALLREQNGLLRKLLEKVSDSPVYAGTGNMISDLKRINRRAGKTIVPVGV